MNQLPTILPTTRQPVVAEADVALAASNDVDAMTEWLLARAMGSDDTFVAYRREGNRLLLWMNERGLTLKQLKIEHVRQFFEHLAAPPKHWLRPRKPKSGEKLAPTQVLTKPLSPKSIAYTRRVLSQMAGFLHEAGYLARNVFKQSARPKVIESSMAHRHLEPETWKWLQGWLKAMPTETPVEAAQAARARWIFALLYHSGMRRQEVAIGRMGDFVREGKAWKLRVVGKGGVERFVTVNSTLLRELVRYRTSLALPAYPVPGEEIPLVQPLRQRDGRLANMTRRAIGLIVGKLADSAAADCSDEHMRARLAAMSTHWMRHTSATHRLQAGASLRTVQEELGHKDPKTTTIYAAAVDEQRRIDAERLAEFDKNEE